MQITLCGKQKLSRQRHNNLRIRELPAYDFVERNKIFATDILLLNLYPANNTELRYLKQHRSFVYNVKNPFMKMQFSSSVLKSLSFLFLTDDILSVRTSGG